jgi:hypothetical protein
VALDVALPAAPARAHALARGLTARVGLTALVAVSFALRTIAAAAHPTPRYFPDEYIYAALARSIGESGRPLVRGGAAHFPALLEPLLAAPLWRLFDTPLAYRLVQAEHALFMSLAAVPVYLLARKLSLSAGYALACGAFAVLLPDLVFSSYELADPVGYPLALGAVTAAVFALDGRSRRAQLAFLALAGLAAFARMQYVVLPVAFVAGAVLVDRRRVLRAHRLPLALLLAPLVGALVVGPSRLLGYYKGVAHMHVALSSVLKWAATDLFLLALVAGVVLVPGAVAGLLSARGRVETAFAAVTVTFAGGLLLEAGLYAANGSQRFQERYLFALLPLVPVAFGLYIRRGRPARVVVALVSAVLLTVAARIPISGYAAADGKTDSPFLVAVFRLERALGTANGSLLVAALAALAAVGAIAVAWRGGTRIAVAATLAAAAVGSFAAVSSDVANTRDIRAHYLPANPSWVDAAGVGDVTAVQTLGSPPDRALEQLFWNRSVKHVAVLGNALPLDAFPSRRVDPRADGTLPGVRGNLLFEEFGASATFDDAVLVRRAGSFALWRAAGSPRLRLLADGRSYDGWLARAGRITVWPDADGRTRGVVSFTVSLPRRTAQPVDVTFGKVRYTIEPGARTTLRYHVNRRGPWTLRFHAAGGTFTEDLRAVSVRATRPTFVRTGEHSTRQRSLTT